MADTELKTLLTKLRAIDFTALDYETIQTELIEYLRIAQSNNGLVDDFAAGDAAKMFIDLISYLGDILAFRIDTLSNEAYLSTAQRRQSIINLLELVAQRPKNPTHSTLTVTAIPSSVSASPITLPLRYQFTATGLNGNNVSFEIMNNPTDYFNVVTIPAGVTNYNLTAYSGSYQAFNVVSSGEPNQEYILASYPVIENSVKVSVTPVTATLLTPEIIESSRVKEVDSLVNAENEIFYRLRYDEIGRGIITFATESFGKIPPAGHTIHVDYRIGGGKNTNIPVGAVNVTGTFSNLAGNLINVTIANPSTFATGGSDLEDLEVVKLRAPALIRANDNLVTVQDYEAIILDIPGVQDVFAVDAHNDTVLYSNKFGVPDNGTFIWVLPESGGEVSPDLRQRIATEIETRRLTAITNFVFNPIYIDWELTCSVNILSTYDVNEVRQKIIDALIKKFGREVATFKNVVRTSQIISTIQLIEGVDYVNLIKPSVDIEANENEVLRLLENNIILTITQS